MNSSLIELLSWFCQGRFLFVQEFLCGVSKGDKRLVTNDYKVVGLIEIEKSGNIMKN